MSVTEITTTVLYTDVIIDCIFNVICVRKFISLELHFVAVNQHYFDVICSSFYYLFICTEYVGYVCDI